MGKEFHHAWIRNFYRERLEISFSTKDRRGVSEQLRKRHIRTPTRLPPTDGNPTYTMGFVLELPVTGRPTSVYHFHCTQRRTILGR